jgi:histidinol-phosphate aminotransferase
MVAGRAGVGQPLKRGSMKLRVPQGIRGIAPYVPGKPIEELEREYGISDSIKLASNENPLGPSPRAVAAVGQALASLHRYPDSAGHDLTRRLAQKLGVIPQNIVLGNGSDEVIGMLARVFLQPGDEVVLPRPSFLMYEIMARAADAVPRPVALRGLTIDLEAVAGAIGPATRMIFLCNPNNPTGTIFKRRDLDRFLERLPEGVVVVLDEAYIEFASDPDCPRGTDYLDSGCALATLRTFSKAYGLAGLRIGYGVMPVEMAALLHRVRQPFNAGTLAQAGALAALDDEPFLDRTRTLVRDGLSALQSALDRLGVRCFPTQSNFFLIDVDTEAERVFEKMLHKGVIVRSMAAYGYPRYIRVNVGLAEENERFLVALKEVLGK